MIPQAFDQIAAFIKGWESCRLIPYRDQAGRFTVGWGHLMLDHEDVTETITQERADELFAADLMPRIHRLEVVVPADLAQHQFDAVLSLAYNIGVPALAGSTLRRCLDAGDMNAAAAQFEAWCKVRDPGSGQLAPSAGLLRRRRAERDIFVSANYEGRP